MMIVDGITSTMSGMFIQPIFDLKDEDLFLAYVSHRYRYNPKLVPCEGCWVRFGAIVKREKCEEGHKV